jgi:hypothetical protein
MTSGRFFPTVNNLVAMVHKQSKSAWLPLLPTVKNLVSVVTIVRIQSKPTVEQGSSKKFEP